MIAPVPLRSLPARPDLDQLKRQAKELLAAYQSGDAAAIAEVTAHYRGADPAAFALHDAQLVLARVYGFDSWAKLKAYVDGVTVSRLAEAVQAGDTAEVERMLRARPELADMELAHNNEHRPLHFAVLAGRPEMLRLLMRHGADARVGIWPHRDATSALQIARDRELHELVAIIEEEEQSRRESSSGGTVTQAQDELSDLLRGGHSERALAMLAADVSLVDGADRDGNRPLHLAAETLDETLLRWLLAHGADASRVDGRGLTPLDRAAVQTGRRHAGDVTAFPAMAALLQQHGAVLTSRGAVALGDLDWLRRRHAAGELANPIDSGAGGLLTVAVKHDQPEALAFLLSAGMDPNERIHVGDGASGYDTGSFPLWHAAADGNAALAEVLLQHGADPNTHVYAAGSSVYSAFSHRHWSVVDLLRRYGGEVTADIVGVYRQADLARELLATKGDGEAPELLNFGAMGGDPEIVAMALARIDWEPDDDRWFYIVCHPMSFWNHIPWLYAGNKELDRGTYLECFRLLLARCNPNLVSRYGRTLLHEVSSMGGGHVTGPEAAAFAQVLLKAGARLDARDELLHSTPLGWAFRWGNVEVARLLLEHGADPVEADAEPWATPRAWAAKMGHAELLGLLE